MGIKIKLGSIEACTLTVVHEPVEIFWTRSMISIVSYQEGTARRHSWYMKLKKEKQKVRNWRVCPVAMKTPSVGFFD